MLRDRLQALWAARGGRDATLAPPEPRLAGDEAAGRRWLAGEMRLGARVLEAPGKSVWDWAPGDPEADQLHDFAWLDDLAALGHAGRARAQAWTGEWLDRFGRGRGPGWTPERTGARLLRLTGHAAFLLKGASSGGDVRLTRSLAAQAGILRRRWRRAPPGLPRLRALAGLLHADLALGRAPLLGPFAAEAVLDADGGVASRAPEDLLDALVLLQGVASALTAKGHAVPPAVTAAIARAAPRLRALRHAGGGLARFHGGDGGPEGRLDGALAAAGRPSMTGARPRLAPGAALLHMGFARLAAGRTTIIVDAAPPPPGPLAHASTLAFEMTAGRRPLIVSAGPGQGFGADWARAARATASHSTLAIEGVSSSRLDAAGELSDAPRRVIAEATPLSGGLRLELAHDGWRPTHGLTHARTLDLSADGRGLAGEDVLTTLTAPDRLVLDQRLDESERLGIAFAVHFHLHPDVEISEEDGGARLSLRSGEAWRLSVEGDCALRIAPSAHLERARPWPRAALQVVLSARALSYATRLRWRLDRLPGPEGLRDLGREEP